MIPDVYSSGRSSHLSVDIVQAPFDSALCFKFFLLQEDRPDELVDGLVFSKIVELLEKIVRTAAQQEGSSSSSGG